VSFLSEEENRFFPNDSMRPRPDVFGVDNMMFSCSVGLRSISLLDAVDGFSFDAYKISQDKIVPRCVYT
jgi:hypothetical protein